jgi:branched-chain amino acid transport system ATP-binding protein
LGDGVGKTTLLKTIAGFVAASDGSMRLGNQRLRGFAPSQTCRAVSDSCRKIDVSFLG